jgi:Tfp pilus tip-associated adhesin PilY1
MNSTKQKSMSPVKPFVHLNGWLVGAGMGLLMAMPSAAVADWSYASTPLFWSSGAEPNVVLLLDDSGSMDYAPSGGGALKIDTMKTVAKQVVTDNSDVMRIGLFHFGSSTSGKLSQNCGTAAATINTSIDNLQTNYATPLGSSLYEVTRYFRGMNKSSASPSTVSPYASPIQYRCQKNFTVLLTDGKPTRGMENPGAGVPNGSLPRTGTTGDTNTGGTTNPWGGFTLDLAGLSWDGYPDPKMSGDSDGYYPLTDDVAQFAYDIDMRGSTSVTTGCPAGSPATGGTAGLDCSGKSWQDTEFPQQNMVTYAIGFDLQNELLSDIPLLAKTDIDSTKVNTSTDTITMVNHGLVTGDYVQYFGATASRQLIGLGNAVSEQVTVSTAVSVPPTGTPLIYNSQGGTPLSYDRVIPAVTSEYEKTASRNTVCFSNGKNRNGNNCSPVNTIRIDTTEYPPTGVFQVTYDRNGDTSIIYRNAFNVNTNLSSLGTIYARVLSSGVMQLYSNAAGTTVLPLVGAGNSNQTFTYTVITPASTVSQSDSVYFAVKIDDTNFKLAFSAADASAVPPVTVNIANGGNASQTFDHKVVVSSIGGLYPYETDLEPDATPDAANEPTARGKYCVLQVDRDNIKLLQAYAGSGTICPAVSATNQPINLTTQGGGALSKGPGETYYSTDAATLSTALNTAFQSINSKTLSASAVAANSVALNDGARIYQAMFSTSDWSGNLLSYAFDITTGAGGQSQVALNATSKWEANKTVAGNGVAYGGGAGQSDARNVLTWNGSAGVNFLYGNLTGTQKTDLNSDANVVRWLRGDTSLGAVYRARTQGVLGDVINSNPVHVGATDEGYSGLAAADGGAGATNDYASYVSGKSTRTKMLFFGANDGMVHGLNADTGAELVAFVPAAMYSDWVDLDNDAVRDAGETVVKKLHSLTQPSYGRLGSSNPHKFFVDGAPMAGDAYFGSAWHTVVLGGYNSGGRGIYALDAKDASFTAADVLWEFPNTATNAADTAAMGYSYSKPLIGKLANGTWAAFFGNGYDSAGDIAELFVVNLANGNVIKKISTSTGSAATPNGMSNIQLKLGGTDGKTVQAVYGGDLLGNVWKFDVSDTSPASWGLAFPGQPLFTANDSSGNSQPITGGIALMDYNGGTMVFVGTGKYFATTDNGYTATTLPHTETMYGLWDNGNTISGRGALVQQSMSAGPTINGTTYRLGTSNTVDYSSKRGWYMDLLVGTTKAGERMINRPILNGPRLIFTTIIPNAADVCAGGGRSALIEINAQSGGAISAPVFDTNNDGQITDADQTAGLMGIEDDSLFSDPTILQNPDGKTETKVIGTTSATAPIKLVLEGGVKCQETNSCTTPSAGRMSWRQLQ